MALTRPKIWDLDTNIQYFMDPITVLRQGPLAAANVDIGFLFNRANGLTANVALYWNEAGNTFVTAYTADSGSVDSNISVSTLANITTGNVIATNFYYPNGAPATLSSQPNLNFYLAKTYANNTANVLVDNVKTTGNTGVRWLVTATDNVLTNVKTTEITVLTDGTNVYYNEFATIQNNNSANVATFYSNVYNGAISLWALGGTSNVTVAAERHNLGSGVTAGYVNGVGPAGPQGLTGPIGPAGIIANTTSWIITTNLTSATSTTSGALQVAGGAGIGGNVYAGNVYTGGLYWSANGNVIQTGGGSGKSTSSATPPGSPGVGDIWYNTTTDDIYRWTTDGTSSYWLDITGPTINTNPIGSFGNITVGNLTTTGTETVNRLVTTTGVFWAANGAAYSSGGGSTPSATTNLTAYSYGAF